MLNIQTLNRYDISGIHKIYDIWPQIAEESYKSRYDKVSFDNVDHIIFAGMGGSGALGDVLTSVLSNSKIHVCVVKGYHLPSTVNSNTLVVVTSISGNTVEMLSLLKSTNKSKCNVITFSSNGKMMKYCEKHKITHYNIEQMHSPRASFTKFLYTILKVMSPVLPLKKSDILDSIIKLKSTSENISSLNLNHENLSLKLAEWISGIPIIYYPFGLQAAAIRFKNSLQENAKTHAMIEDVIEACHNGIVAWERPSIVQPILIEGVDDYIKTKERWKILKEYFETNRIGYREIFSVQGSILSKIINLIYMLDYATIYLAILLKTDPSPIRSIDYIKNKISKF